MAVVHYAQQALEVHDRRHGTQHTLTLGLPDLVAIMDPHGTRYTAVLQ